MIDTLKYFILDLKLGININKIQIISKLFLVITILFLLLHVLCSDITSFGPLKVCPTQGGSHQVSQ